MEQQGNNRRRAYQSSHTGLFDLGRNGLGWNNIYASSTIYTGAGGTSLSTLSPNILPLQVLPVLYHQQLVI